MGTTLSKEHSAFEMSAPYLTSDGIMKRMTWLVLPLLFVETSVSMNAIDSLSFAGYVFDGETVKPLVGANVTIQGTYLGCATDQNGRFYIDKIVLDSISFSVSYIGCFPSIGRIALSKVEHPPLVYIYLSPIPFYNEPSFNRFRTHPVEWKRTNVLDRFSFSIPNDLADSKLRGIDSEARMYISDSLKITFDFGVGAYFPSAASIKRTHTIIGCRHAVLEQILLGRQAEFPFIVAAQFDQPFTFWVSYKDRRQADIALRILYSISFP